jgi:hypothetical protein
MYHFHGHVVSLVHAAGEAGIKVIDLAAKVNAKVAPTHKTVDGARLVYLTGQYGCVEVYTREGVVVRVKAA